MRLEVVAWDWGTRFRSSHIAIQHSDGPVLSSRQRLRSQNAKETASTAARPNQVIAYCRWSLGKLISSGPGCGRPPGGVGLSSSTKKGAAAPHLLAWAMASGSRANHRLW